MIGWSNFETDTLEVAGQAIAMHKSLVCLQEGSFESRFLTPLYLLQEVCNLSKIVAETEFGEHCRWLGASSHGLDIIIT